MTAIKGQYMKTIKLILISLLPLLICVLMLLIAMMVYYFSKGVLRRELLFVFTEVPKHAVFQSPPFIAVAICVFRLLQRGRSKREIALRMMLMLGPLVTYSLFWYSRTFSDPLALAVLPVINLVILIPGWLIGRSIWPDSKDAESNERAE